MAIIVNGKVYRNLQEQVYENTKDIEELQKTVPAEITQTFNDYGIQYKEGDLHGELQLTKSTIVGDQLVVKSPGAEKIPLVDIFGTTYIGGALELEGTLNCRNGKIKFGNDYLMNLPSKSGTLALVEDIPVNTGEIKAHTIENDTAKNYTTVINLGSGNSGSTLSLTAPGDNGIATLELANEYNQGSTAIKFTADKLVFGNTEITEQQLQQLLALIA